MDEARLGLADFKRTREAALLSSFTSLPDVGLSRAERVTDFIGTADYPTITRRHIVRPGVALVGDAAMLGMIYGAASHNQRVADRVMAVVSRNSSPLTLFDPILLTRAAFAQRRPVTPV